MKTLLCSLFLFLSVSVYAQTDRTVLIHDILAASGMKEEANKVSVEVREHFAPVLKEMAAQPAEVFRTQADKTFAGDSLYPLIEQYWFDKADDVSRLQAVRDWLVSPLAVRMRQLEREAARPEAGKQIAEYIERLPKDTAQQRRNEMLSVLGNGAIQSTVHFLTDLTEQVFLLFNTPSQNEQKMTEQEIRGIVDNMRKGMLEYYGTSMLGFYAYAYRSVPDEELQQYVNFYTNTDEGKWFAAFSDEAYFEVCQATSQKFISQLADTYASMIEKAAMAKSEAQPADSTEGTELEKMKKDLQQKSNGGQIIGMVEATVNSVKWYGYLNAEDNHNGTITILALNNDLDPMEQAEITFSFKGTGTYRIEKQFAGIFRFKADRTVLSEFRSRGAAADKVIITSYDKLTNIIEGKISFTAYGKDGDVTFTSMPFAVRIR